MLFGKTIGKPEVLWAGVAGVLFGAAAYYVLDNGHLYEDAYILLIYAENLLAGEGIVFYPGGEHAEGATDFLWLVLIVALSTTGLDIAVSAAVLNSIGAALICLVVVHAVRERAGGGMAHAAGAFVAVLLVVSPLAVAALGGFSVMLFAALILLLFYIHWRAPPRYFPVLPWLGLTLALFRPDGAVVGIAATLLAAMQVWRTPHLRPYLMSAALAGAVGLAYFAWRYSYFGALLPLPLYVKGDADLATTAVGHLRWISQIGWLSPFVFFAIVRDERWRRLLAAALPSVALVVAYLFVAHLQNVGFRFQNAVFGVLLLLSVLGMVAIASGLKRVSAGWPRYGFLAVCFLAFAASSVARMRHSDVSVLTQFQYINYLPYYLRQSTPSDAVLAITEAGRFPFWMTGRKLDLIGLNTPQIAFDGVNLEYLNAEKPDLIFFHTSHYLRVPPCAAPFSELRLRELHAMRAPGASPWQDVDNRVDRAPAVALAYFAERPDAFPYFVICLGPGAAHVYGVRRNGRIAPDDFRRALELSHERSRAMSYLDMRRRTSRLTD